jgi:hypothetical protein
MVKRKYPWDEWTDGRPHRLTHGEDYDKYTGAFRAYLYQYAANHGLKVSAPTWSDPVTGQEGLTITFETKIEKVPEPEGQPSGSQYSEEDLATLRRLEAMYGPPPVVE